MKLRVSLELPNGGTHDIVLSCDVTATVGDAARALARSGATQDAELVLDVVAYLMRHDIGHGEIAARAQLLLHRGEEVGIEIHLLVARAVERPRRPRGIATRRIRYTLVQDQNGGGVVAVQLGLENIGPDLLGIGQNNGNEFARLHIGSGQLGDADIADAVLFLASERAGYISGQEFLVDGGLTQAWLSASLAISPQEQARFLGKMVSGKLPVSAQTLQYTANILKVSEIDGWQIHGKTGMGYPKKLDGSLNREQQIGWFVGWATRDDRRVIFARLTVGAKKGEQPAGPAARDDFLTPSESV